METLTVATFFETVSGTVTGLVTSAGSFVGTLYSTNVIGAIIVTLGMATLVIGLGRSIFLRKHRA